MLFAVILIDKSGLGEVRAKNLEAHVQWLEAHRDIISVGGSLRSEIGQTPKGGLWIANAESKEQLDHLLKTDPFYISGLRESYEILYWSKANAERKVLI